MERRLALTESGIAFPRSLRCKHRTVCHAASSTASAPAAPPAGSGLALLKASRLLAIKGVGGCKHPCKPAPLRRQVASPADVLVELVVLRTGGHPSCLLPMACPLSEEVLALTGLQQLSPANLVPSLTQLAQYLAAAGLDERAALAQWPGFIAFLERGLEVTCQSHQGPAPPLLLLRMLSLLPLGSGSAAHELQEGYGQYLLHLANALEDAVKREPAGLSAQEMVGAYESWACLGLDGAPLNASVFTLSQRKLIRLNAFSAEEAARMLCALGTLLRHKRINPSASDVKALAAKASVGLRQLSSTQLRELARGCAGFPWPTYSVQVELLGQLAEEGLRRAVKRAVANPAADSLVAAAVASAHSLRPRLGQDLEARVARWAGAVGAGAAAAGMSASLAKGRAPVPVPAATKAAGQGLGKQLPALARA